MTGSTTTVVLEQVRKRDGQVVAFDLQKIVRAISKALKATNEVDDIDQTAHELAEDVAYELQRRTKENPRFATPTVETVQNIVEEQLMASKLPATAKAYILYRSEHEKRREAHGEVSQELRNIVRASSGYFDTPYQEFIFYLSYARWQDDLGRRETWLEAIDRFMVYMETKLGDKLTQAEYEDVKQAILNREVCPSMRLLWSAGEACDATNAAAYNCAYIAPTTWRDLSEIMYVSMCGAGCGFAVEEENVSQFPIIKKQQGSKLSTIVIEDSKEGWCEAYAKACEIWASGNDVWLDYSQLRPAGARLMTMGGRSSGPEPLRDLMRYTRSKILSRQGTKLTTLDLHDMICQIGLIVVAGGVRRSALISLSELGDAAMRDAKRGAFWHSEGQRQMANNSAIYNTKPLATEFLVEYTAMATGGTGERGIYNRGGLEQQVPARRWEAIKSQRQVGVNPCGEIYLRSKQFCNLSSIVVRPDDDMNSLKRKIRLATLLGTYQATLTDFGYLSQDWQDNCEAEQLLGVSITGYYDNEIVRNDDNLQLLRQTAVKMNVIYAKRFGSNQSTAVTCVKPHGNSGQLLGVGSGMHPWFSRYYIRRVRISVNDPLLQLAREQGVPIHPEVGYTENTAKTMVMEFPVKAPDGAVVADDVPALTMLEEWRRLKLHFTEHNPSVTIYVGDDEWIKVANFVYDNWEIVGGLSFLPRTDSVYELAPYEAISEQEYQQRLNDLGEIDFSKLVLYEYTDQTNGAKELACAGGSCEL